MTDQAQDKRDFGFYQVDNRIITEYGSLIGVYGIAVYSAISYHANRKDGTSFPAIATIAKETGCSSRKVTSTIQQLEELRLISVTPRTTIKGKRTSNLYTLLNLPMQEVQGTHAGGADTSMQEVQGTHAGGAEEQESIEQNENNNNQDITNTVDITYIFPLYEQATGNTIAPKIAEDLADVANDHPEEWVRKAFKLSVGKDNRWAYVKGVLKNWYRSGEMIVYGEDKPDAREPRQNTRKAYTLPDDADQAHHSRPAEPEHIIQWRMIAGAIRTMYGSAMADTIHDKLTPTAFQDGALTITGEAAYHEKVCRTIQTAGDMTGVEVRYSEG